jgi:hypothetical protein
VSVIKGKGILEDFDQNVFSYSAVLTTRWAAVQHRGEHHDLVGLLWVGLSRESIFVLISYFAILPGESDTSFVCAAV